MEVQNELQNITQRQEEALSNERIARDECQNQLKLAQEVSTVCFTYSVVLWMNYYTFYQ